MPCSLHKIAAVMQANVINKAFQPVQGIQNVRTLKNEYVYCSFIDFFINTLKFGLFGESLSITKRFGTLYTLISSSYTIHIGVKVIF